MQKEQVTLNLYYYLLNPFGSSYKFEAFIGDYDFVL